MSQQTNGGQVNVVVQVLLGIVAGILIIVSGYVTYVWQHDKVDRLNKQVTSLESQIETMKKQTPLQTSYSFTSSKGVAAIVYAPVRQATVTSPVAVIGEIPGNWSFEASFPVQLKDSAGNVIAQASARVLGDWMTGQLVPFSVQLTYPGSLSGSGTLVLQKDNPSGLPQNDDTISISVRF